MTVISDYLTDTVELDVTPEYTPLDRKVVMELNQLANEGAPDTPASMAAADEVITIGQHTGGPSSGQYKITVDLANGESFTTADIAYDAIDSAIETAIDVAATAAAITGWTNGDISVAGATPGDGLDLGDVTFTFDGASVTEASHSMSIAQGTTPFDAGDVGTVTTVTTGQTKRVGWAMLVAYGIAAGTIPAEGELPTDDLTRGPGSRLSNETIRAIASDIAVEEGNAALAEAITQRLCTSVR